jgi:hypothetical protein
MSRALVRSLLLLMVLALAPAPAHAGDDHRGSSDPSQSARIARVATSDSISYAARVLNGNKLGLTLTNYGFIGTNFSSAAPSFEYPLGSSHMHMVRGGMWIGAISADQDGAFTGVSIAA